MPLPPLCGLLSICQIEWRLLFFGKYRTKAWMMMSKKKKNPVLRVAKKVQRGVLKSP